MQLPAFFLMLFIAGYSIVQIDDIGILLAIICIAAPVYIAIFLSLIVEKE
jgi:hypothetical protein